MKTLYLVRHGQAANDLLNYDDLTDLGARQTHRLGQHYRDQLAGARYTAGTLRRQQLSAASFLHGAGVTDEVGEDPRFNEFDFLDIVANFRTEWHDTERLQNDLAGQADPARYFLRVFRDALHHWMSDPVEHRFIETWPAFVDRIQNALNDLKPDQEHWVFTSGGVISAAVAATMEADGKQAIHLNLGIANASVTTLAHIGGRWRLQSFNQTQYLMHQPELLTFR